VLWGKVGGFKFWIRLGRDERSCGIEKFREHECGEEGSCVKVVSVGIEVGLLYFFEVSAGSGV